MIIIAQKLGENKINYCFSNNKNNFVVNSL